jgi:pimeloyl-ACP methyl ester carboxylesterase
VEQLVVVNCPPVDVIQRILWRYPSQLFRSWYIMAMQMPAMAEWFLSRQDHASLQRTMIDSSAPETFDEASLEGHRDAWSQPGALQSMINWYRAGFWSPPRLGTRRIEVPTLLL